MPSFLIRALSERMGLPVVDATNIDAFLMPGEGEAEHCLLFFTGDPAVRSESNDVAVVMPEILQSFQGRLRGAVVARAAEEKLKARFHVMVLPSLVVTRRDDVLGVLPKICDWTDYMERVGRWLEPGVPAMPPSAGPKVEINYTGKGASA
jgi:hydrogenase-1 operon protein HyaE